MLVRLKDPILEAWQFKPEYLELDDMNDPNYIPFNISFRRITEQYGEYILTTDLNEQVLPDRGYIVQTDTGLMVYTEEQFNSAFDIVERSE